MATPKSLMIDLGRNNEARGIIANLTTGEGSVEKTRTLTSYRWPCLQSSDVSMLPQAASPSGVTRMPDR
jgi:hypothetical protein